MTDSTTGHVSPYHPGCKHRYSEHMDHNALIARLNDIADQQYKLLQLCNQLESNLTEHDNSETAHAYIRTIINNTSTRLGVIKAQIDADLATLRNTHTNDISTLTAADTAIQSRIDSLSDELDRVEREFTVNLTNIDHAINSNVSSGNLANANNGTVIINGTAAAGYNMLYKGKSTHGKFTTGIDNTSYVVNYSADANNTNTPTYKATLLDENGNASFPNTVAATTFSGNATSATVANTAGKLTNSFNLSIQDASGNNSGTVVAVDGSRDVVLKMPDTLSNTNITGTANCAYADGSGANIADTYVHKTNVDETVAGTKSFSGTVKGNTIMPVTHAGATVGTNATPYENVCSTNFNGTNANINNITGNLTGNATSATKLQTARAINGTNFDGTGAITTEKWGTARDINIADASGTNSGAASSINGSGNVTLKLPATIKANVIGNASTATQLSGSKKINGTVFNGINDITTEKWGTARNISIADASGTNTGAATSVNGDANVTLKLPATIKGTLTGNADSATEFSSNATVAITGDATGTSAGSKKGWSVPITLANSGVVAGTYGPSGNVTGEDGVTISVPQITVDAKGRVTSVTNRTYTSVNNTDDVDWSLYPYKLNSISPYGHGRWEYINLENTASNDFNSLVAPGKFQVRYNANTLNAPVSDGSSHDGILEVDGTTSATNVSPYQRCYQTYTLYSNGRPRQFIRKGYYYNGAWNWDSEWTELARTADLGVYVTLNTEQTISGNKRFSGYTDVDPYRLRIKHNSQVVGTTPSSNQWNGIIFTDKDAKTTFSIEQGYLNSGSAIVHLSMLPNSTSSSLMRILESTYYPQDGSILTRTRTLLPSANSSYDLGSSGAKWRSIYCENLKGHADTATNVTGTVAIANGGTGATSRLNAVKNLTNENVGTGTQYFLTITSSWGKAGYCSVADAKTVLSIPTKTSQLTNDSGYLTSHQSLSNYSTLANTVKSLSISGKTITVTPGSGSAYTLTTQDTTYSNFVKSGSGAKAGLVPSPGTTAGTTKYLREDGTWQVPPDHTYTVNNATLTIKKNGSNVATFTSNASSNVTANITVPTKTSQLTNDSGFITINSIPTTPNATRVSKGVVQIGDGINVDGYGKISVDIPTVFGVHSFRSGKITTGEKYMEFILDLGIFNLSQKTSRQFVQIRIGSAYCPSGSGSDRVVKWDKSMVTEHRDDALSYTVNMDTKVILTPSRGSSGGDRWGDDYFCVFAQNISNTGFHIYSNHLDEGGSSARVDFVVFNFYYTTAR